MLEIIATSTIVFREGFEAMLLTSMLAGLQRNGNMSMTCISIGAVGGLLLSLVFGYLINQTGIDLERYGWVLSLTTALVLTYVVTMNARVSKHVKEHVMDIVAAPTWAVIFAVAAIFLREGMEVVLMLYGMAMREPLTVMAGSLLGLGILLGMGLIVRNEILMRLGIGKTMLISNILLGIMAIFFYAEAYSGYFHVGS